MIRCIYIDDTDDTVHGVLRAAQYPFYDATDYDPVLEEEYTLEGIETLYQSK